MDFSGFFLWIIIQPWAFAVAIGIGAFLVGLLMPKKGGSSWLNGVLFFLPNLLLDLLDIVHTKKFKYYGLILALLCIEAFFAFRASTVYYDVLNTHMASAEMIIVCIMVFVAVFLCGYMVATHGKMTLWSGCTMAFVIMHDWAGTVWMNYTQPGSTNINTDGGALKVILTIGMCVLSILPFIMGAWAEELRPQLEEEMEEEVNAFTSTATRKIKRRAVDRVLRLANHTNVVHLVRALPSDEFLDFKQFVMPIIAPGTPYNLPENPSEWLSENSQSDRQEPSEMIDQNETIRQSENTHPDGQKPTRLTVKNQSSDSQIDNQKSVKATRKNQSKWMAETTQASCQNDDHLIVKTTRKNLSNDGQSEGQNDTQKPASKTARRDAKIRQFAANHPELTHAKLATRFKVSVSTIARALSPQMRNTDEMVAIEKPSTNGHHKERDTDELVKLGEIAV